MDIFFEAGVDGLGGCGGCGCFAFGAAAAHAQIIIRLVLAVVATRAALASGAVVEVHRAAAWGKERPVAEIGLGHGLFTCR